MAKKIVKTGIEVAEDYRRGMRNGLARIGIDVDLGPETDEYIRSVYIGRTAEAVFNNIEAAEEAKMVDTAGGPDLDRLLNQFGLSRRSAATSTGRITFNASQAALVPVGAELSAPQGIIFRVTQGGTYADGDTIPVESVDTGAAANLPAGTTLKWASPPVYSANTAILSTASSGAVDEEVDEVARQRLQYRLAHPPAAGNPAWIKALAESADPSVQVAFVYPCGNGPGTVYVACAAAPSAGNKTRQIDPIKLNSVIIPTVLGSMAAGVETVVQNVNDVPTDVSIKLSLPAGTANGWKNTAPFPKVNGQSSFYSEVVFVASSSQITITSDVAPSAGVSRISWIDRSDYSVKTATVMTFTPSGDEYYELTLDSPFVGVQTGDWVSPDAANMQTYVNTALEHFSLMGPGERTNAPSLIPRALRKPEPAEAWNHELDDQMLQAINDASEEVRTSSFLHRSSTTPEVPTNINTPVNILIPRRLGFYS